MRSALLIALVALTTLPSAARAGAEWLHIEIRESEWRRASVVVNLPVSSLAQAIPLLPESRLRTSRIQIRDAGIREYQLREIISSLVSTGAASCDCDGRSITAVVDGELVRFDVEQTWGDERVTASVPLDVVRALGGGAGPGLDYLAALKVVVAHGGGELALLTADDTRVRIWLDDLAEPQSER
ncbi:MAG: hypothetical protein ABR517_06785 [Thermoanaerobaculia bacterium]